MASILIAYETTEGQTEKIATHIAEVLRRAGKTVHIGRVDALPEDLDLSLYDGVLVGASVHGGRHQRAVVTFVKRHREELERAHNGFFSVSMSSARGTEEGYRLATECVERFEAETGWRPERVVLFAGALLFTHYGFVKRYIMKRISASTGGPTDTSRDYEFTDWSSVDHFAMDFLSSAAAPRVEPAAGGLHASAASR